MTRPLPAPTFGHAAEAFVVAHEAPGAWASGIFPNGRRYSPRSAVGGRFAPLCRGPADIRHGASGRSGRATAAALFGTFTAAGAETIPEACAFDGTLCGQPLSLSAEKQDVPGPARGGRDVHGVLGYRLPEVAI